MRKKVVLIAVLVAMIGGGLAFAANVQDNGVSLDFAYRYDSDSKAHYIGAVYDWIWYPESGNVGMLLKMDYMFPVSGSGNGWKLGIFYGPSFRIPLGSGGNDVFISPGFSADFELVENDNTRIGTELNAGVNVKLNNWAHLTAGAAFKAYFVKYQKRSSISAFSFAVEPFVGIRFNLDQVYGSPVYRTFGPYY